MWEDRPFPVPGFESAYSINQIGHIRGFRHKFGIREHGRPLSWNRDPGGWYFAMWSSGARQKYWVRDLVLLAFGEPAPSKDHKCYCLDGDNFNHVLWNLAWLTREQAIERRLAVDVRITIAEVSRKRLEKHVRVVNRDDYDLISALHRNGISLTEIWKMHFQRRMSRAVFYGRWKMMKQHFGGENG